eukprot:6908_1
MGQLQAKSESDINSTTIDDRQYVLNNGHVAEYDDFIVEPSFSLSINEYIPLLLRFFTKQIKNILIPDVIIQLIISYYPCGSTYKIYQVQNKRIKLLTELSKLCSKHPSNIYYGFQKHFIQTQTNELYAIGLNCYGSLGINSNENFVHQCSKLKFNPDIDIISNGIATNHTFIVTQNGTIYGFGSNTDGELGIETVNRSHRIPVIAKMLNTFFYNIKIIKIQCGRDYSLFLCENKRVYSLGNNQSGQCGLNFNDRKYGKTISKPIIIDKLKNIEDICCGGTFNICLDKCNKIWCFGDNSAGYLGLPHNKDICVPLLHPFFKSMNSKYIRCGSRHCLIVLFNGRCFLFGSDSNGQCNYTSNELKDIVYPNPHLYAKYVKNGWCGSNHSVVYTIDNELIAFGSVKFAWNRNQHSIKELKENQYIVRVMPVHHATFLVVSDNNNDIQ